MKVELKMEGEAQLEADGRRLGSRTSQTRTRGGD